VEGSDCQKNGDGTSLRIRFMVGDLELNLGEAILNGSLEFAVIRNESVREP
jgi:hypothetical protein